MIGQVTPARSAAVVACAALLVFANSLSNGFAFDDETFIVSNPVVTEPSLGEAFTEASWPGALEGEGNYRPLVLTSFAAEFALWEDRPLGYHVVSVLAHAAVCVLVLLLLGHFTPSGPALAGALFFAVHPVHVEAVANVMGRSELYAALGYLGACLVYLRDRPSDWSGTGLRMLTLLVLTILAVGSKEIAVTLPAALLLLELARDSDTPLRARLGMHLPTYAAVSAVIACYLVVRWDAIGSFTGEAASVGLEGLGPVDLRLAALAVWPHYLRLMVAPFDLASDYGPDVLPPVSGFSLGVAAGLVVAIGVCAAAWRLRRRHPVASLGLVWFVIVVSPVSNLLVRSDVLLAERTLYLPSVGAAIVVAAAAAAWAGSPERGRRALAAIAVVLISFSARTLHRNPSWDSSFSALTTLAIEHPESWLSFRTHATALAIEGDDAGAAAAYDEALARAPTHYQLLLDAADFHAEAGRIPRAIELLERARATQPRRDRAHVRLGNLLLRMGEGRRAHAVALEGLRSAEDPASLWTVVSESYVAKADLVAAARARHTSLALGADPAFGWGRLAEIYSAKGRHADADEARNRALEVRAAGGGS